MPDPKDTNLFVSHPWRHHDDYRRLVDLLQAAPLFRFKTYSIPEHDSVLDPNQPTGRRQLEAALERQIRPVHCVLVLSGMYAAHSYWIDKEMAIAARLGKPIVGLIPWGQERVPHAVQSIAREMVGWRTDSITAAIRKWSI